MQYKESRRLVVDTVSTPLRPGAGELCSSCLYLADSARNVVQRGPDACNIKNRGNTPNLRRGYGGIVPAEACSWFIRRRVS
jgi:hypothetical protein